jgi:hypothetical protein
MSQTFGVVSHCFKCLWQERLLDCNVAWFSIQNYSLNRKQTLERWCFKLESCWFFGRGWRLWKWCDEQEEQLGITTTLAKSIVTNEVNINLFTLQPTQQTEDDVKEHHLVGDCGGSSTNSPSKEGLPQMDQMEYRRMNGGWSSNYGGCIQKQIEGQECGNRGTKWRWLIKANGYMGGQCVNCIIH